MFGPHALGHCSLRRPLPLHLLESPPSMPLYLTASHSSRVQKPASLRRASSSPFSAAARTKAGQRTRSLALEREHDALQAERLDATGKVVATLPSSHTADVMSALDHTSSTMFGQIPDRAGMNSVRIAEVLNFRKNLPPVVSLAHVHALIPASSKVEREIASLMAAGSLRKLKIVGRGNDVSGISQVLVSTKQLEKLLRDTTLADGVVENFLDLLRQRPRITSFSSRLLPVVDTVALMHEGFLVSSSLSGTSNSSLGGASLVATPSISRAASGSIAAVGGDSAFEQLGGVGAARRSHSAPASDGPSNELYLSVPNIGPYLRLLHAARTHLIELLGQSKYREAPLYLLQERWDGGVDSDSRVSSAKRLRGEFSSILPAKTKKWKDLHGLNFDWALEECLGAGLVELFETHSVGLGVRALT